METGGEGTLRALASRLLSERYFEEDAEAPELYVGELPEGLPFEIPMPEGVSLVGSLARDIDPKFADYTKRNMAFDVVDVLGWKDFASFNADILSLS